jgi:hypothetical protein
LEEVYPTAPLLDGFGDEGANLAETVQFVRCVG